MYISDFGDRFSFKSGSHYNLNENVLIWIKLTISLSANKLRISFARSVEAAGNNEPPSETNGLQVRREAQDFRRGDVKVVSFADVRE